MSKNHKILLLALGLGTLGAAAQSVTVVLNDGTQHKFCTDYVKDISFEEVQPQAPTIAMTKIEMNPYGGGNCGVTMKDAYDENQFVFDLYGSSDASYLESGTYTVGATEGFHIDVNPQYTYVMVGSTKKELKGGTVEVSRQDRTYTIVADLELADGTATRGKFIGELPSYSPFIEVTLTGAKYLTNPQPKGQFYIKLNDTNWDCEMAAVLCADPEATTLPAGKYTYADTSAPGTISTASYVQYSRKEMKFAPGSEIDVKLDGTTYSMEMDLILDDGRIMTATFSGEISETPIFSEAPEKALKKSPVPYFKPLH